MSILIKGIDMPKKGEHILALIKNDGKCSYFEETTISRIMKTTEAIQIPTPHGRLGDLDVLLEESLKEGAYNYVDSWQIAEQPTILEAEE